MRSKTSNKSLPFHDSVRVTTELTTFNRQGINQYTYCKRLKESRGSSVEISLCQDGSTGSQVLIKAVKRKIPEDKYRQLRRSYQTGTHLGEQFARKEVAILQTCRHPHIVRLLEVVDDIRQDRIFLVLEYISGGQVQWRNSKDEPILMVSQARRIFRDVLLGLEYLHDQGILHFDIKPANLVWSADRSIVKIIDFGISHLNETAKSKSLSLQSRTSLFPNEDLLKQRGTSYFMSPEVAWIPPDATTTSLDTLASASTVQPAQIPHERPPISTSVDVWSLGVTLYCFLFGRFPFYIPSNSNGNQHHNRFVLFKRICTLDWTPGEFMGAERIPIAVKDRSALGSNSVIDLLDLMLMKDPTKRPSVQDLKLHGWVVSDIAKPEEWIRMTSVTAPKKYTPGSWFHHVGCKLSVVNPCRSLSWNLCG